MFVRFRQVAGRLQLSVVQTRDLDGKVRRLHVASLGSIATPPSISDRVVFWRRLRERLAKLSDRIDPETQERLISEVEALVPQPSADEQHDRLLAGVSPNRDLTAEQPMAQLATIMATEGEAEAATPAGADTVRGENTGWDTFEAGCESQLAGSESLSAELEDIVKVDDRQ